MTGGESSQGFVEHNVILSGLPQPPGWVYS
jgi:hypothetical protein